MSDPKNPVPGDTHIDASDLAMSDMLPEQILTLIKLHDGSDKAIANVKRLKPEEVTKAGITKKDFQVLLAIIADYERTNALLPSTQKLLELLYVTKLERGHRMSILFGEICAQARRRAKRDPKGAEILGSLQDLLDYQYGPIRRGAAIRVKKAKMADVAKGTSAAPDSAPSSSPQ